MFRIILAALIETAAAVCFNAITSSIPRIPIEVTIPTTLPECKLACIKKPACESVFFNDADFSCIFLGAEIQGQCTAPYSRHVKQYAADCANSDITAGYVRDPCFASAISTPQHLQLETGPVCPNRPVDGESSPRVYVVSVVYADGSYGMYDDDGSGKIYWNSTIGSFAYYYLHQGIVRFDDPVYAATCVYYTHRDDNDCPCAPLPLETASAGRTGATQITLVATEACPGYKGSIVVKKNLNIVSCGPCTGSQYNIYCINKEWILSRPEGSNVINSFILSNATCHL